MTGRSIAILLSVCSLLLFEHCAKDPEAYQPANTAVGGTQTPYKFKIPAGFPTQLNISVDNPLTIEGVALGKKLFYDSILSGNNKQSCASCHAQGFAFSDHNKNFSTGITGAIGTRNAQPVFNIAWSTSFFWDGRSVTAEEQALQPVPNPKEMNLSWSAAVNKLKASTSYPALFEQAFNTKEITKELVAKALAQFQRTIVSANSKYDKWLSGQAQFDSSEIRGYNIFFSEKGDCFHCHGNILFTDNRFHNNGLDAFPGDLGLAAVTNNSSDEAKFKTPSLRNLAFTAPYMHDSRFTTLQQVVDFYSSGLKFSATVDPLMKKVNYGGVQLTTQEKQDLIAFLLTLTDSSLIVNPAYAP